MIDLHLHSTASDGTLTPEEVVREAEEAGMSAIALTDHDTVAGVPAALAEGNRRRVEVVAGVELSLRHEGGTFHLIGLFLDPEDPGLADLLTRIREGRRRRNFEMVRRLGEIGAPVSIEEVAALAGDPAVGAGGPVIGRPHFARALVARGHVRSFHEAFQSLIGRGRKAYVNRYRPGFDEASAVLHGAGAVAVLCHPHTLGLSEEEGGEMEVFVRGLADAGLDAMEVRYPDYGAGRTKHYRGIAARCGLLLSGGSDFHGSGVKQVRIGGGLRIPDEMLEPLRERAARHRNG